MDEGLQDEARSIVDHVADALDGAPPYVMQIMAMLSEINKERIAKGLPMIDGDGNVVINAGTLGEFFRRD